MKQLIIILLLAPIGVFCQTVKISAGPSFSVVVAPLPAQNTTDNAVVGFSGTVGLDFAEMKKTFLSASVGLLQKGRRDDVKIFDGLGVERGARSVKTLYTYGTASFTANYKLANEGLIPFFSIGPRVDFLTSGKNNFDNAAFGISAGFGLVKKLDKLDLGGRADYFASFGQNPKTRAGAVMVFFGFKLGK